MPAANYNTALVSLSAENVSTRAMAENFQYFRDEIYHPMIAITAVADRGNGGSIGDARMNATGLKAGLHVFPNPFNEEVVFDLNGLDEKLEYKLIITDILGRIVFTRSFNGSNRINWNSNGLPEGRYVYQVRSEKAILESSTLVKIRP